jgi:hypothetical protein
MRRERVDERQNNWIGIGIVGALPEHAFAATGRSE